MDVYHCDLDQLGCVKIPELWHPHLMCEELTLIQIKGIEGVRFLRGFQNQEFMRRFYALFQGRWTEQFSNPILRAYIGVNSDRCPVDKKWRLRLRETPQFRRLFDTEVTFIGHGGYFELWRTDNYWQGLFHSELEGTHGLF